MPPRVSLRPAILKTVEFCLRGRWDESFGIVPPFGERQARGLHAIRRGRGLLGKRKGCLLEDRRYLTNQSLNVAWVHLSDWMREETLLLPLPSPPLGDLAFPDIASLLQLNHPLGQGGFRSSSGNPNTINNLVSQGKCLPSSKLWDKKTLWEITPFKNQRVLYCHHTIGGKRAKESPESSLRHYAFFEFQDLTEFMGTALHTFHASRKEFTISLSVYNLVLQRDMQPLA